MQNKPSKPSNRKPQVDSFLRYGNMAFQLFAAILIGVYGGIWLDEKLHTRPWFTVVLSLLGISAGMYSVLKDFIKPRK